MWRINLAMAIGLGACHPAMMNDLEAMRGYIDDTRRETSRHLDAARAALTMEDMRAEMTRHRDDMTPMMFDIDTTMDGMISHCDDAGLDDMRAMHGELDGEMTQHASTVDAIDDLEAAVVETERHASTMMTTMEGMDGAMERMHCR